MKSLIASSVILVLLAVFTVFGSVRISESIDEISATVEKIDGYDEDFTKIHETALSAERKFGDGRSLFSILINDKDMDEISTNLEDLKSAAESQSLGDVTKAKNRLIAKLEQMKRLSVFNIDSIF